MGILREITLIKVLFFLMFLSASWDIFANIKVSGYSVRLFYFIEMFLLLILAYRMYEEKHYTLKVFPGHTFFVIWMLFIFYAIPNTTILTRNIGYFAWLLLSYLLLILIINFITSKEKFLEYVKIYLYSYIAMATFGLVQFIAGLFGISLKTAQWWIPGVLPRVNGLNYEPSYYGTYISGGAAFLYWLTFIEKREIIPYQKFLTLFTILITLLSTSRIAMLTLFFIILIHIFKEVIIPVSKGVLTKTGLKVVLVYSFLLSAAVVYLLTHIEKFLLLFWGIGLFGMSAHSVIDRLAGTIDTFKIFLENPIIGVSLGGIPSHRAMLYDILITTQVEAKNFEGLNVLVEVMAASGVIGFIFFVSFWINALYMHRKLASILKRKNHLLVALANAAGMMVFTEMFALLFNQNILRPYLWLSIGIYMVSLRILQEEAHSIGNEKAGS